ncbi:hypothetical protein C8R46DRAFT_1284697 [Mycena filopes]|nr:hypothetical protein C8R46DRAFT_1284697 [Mycena filopes]
MLASEPFPSRSLPSRHSLTPPAENSLSSAHESEHERSGARTDPQSVPNRRHSLVLTRKPLRSSPLAGPALSTSQATPDDERGAIRRVRRSSTPNLRSLARSDTPPPIPPLPTSPAVKRLSRRASFVELVKRPLGYKRTPPPLPPLPPLSASVAGSSIAHTPPSPPPSSPRRRSHARSPSSMTASMSSPDVSTLSITPPNFPRALTAPSPSRRTSTIPLPSTHTRDPTVPIYGVTASRSGLLSDETWLAAMPYDSIPRFTRRSLTSSNVVLPVSARDARRKSLRGAGGNRISLAYPSPTPATPPRCSSLEYADPASCRPPSLLRSRSRSLSSEGPATPSESSVFGGDGSIMLADDNDPPYQRAAIDLERMLASSVRGVDSGIVHALKSTLAEAARSTWSLSLRRHRPPPVPAPGHPMSKAAPSFVSSTPRAPSFVSSHSEVAPSFVSSSTSRPPSGVSFSTSADAPASTPARRSRTPSPLASRPLSTAPPYTVDDLTGYDPYAELEAPPPPRSTPVASKRPVGTIRRMLHAFPGVRRLKERKRETI